MGGAESWTGDPGQLGTKTFLEVDEATSENKRFYLVGNQKNGEKFVWFGEIK